MSAAGPSAITDAVLDSFAATPEPRLKAIVTALVRHGHAFVGEVRPTQAEWAAAVAFLKRAGDISQGARQEFILLSDVLGVSMLVDALGHDGDVAATDSTVLGPFYVEGAPVLAAGADIAAGSEGAPLWIDIVVADVDGAPVTGAVVDIWQTDGDGLYDVQRDLPADAHATRGRFRSNEAGRVCCWSVVPISYQIPSDGPVGDLLAATGRHPWRPAHVHFRIAADGWRPLVTHLFVSGDAYLDSDAVFGVKPSLIVDLPAQDRPAPPGRVVDGGWCRLDYRFVLQREGR